MVTERAKRTFYETVKLVLMQINFNTPTLQNQNKQLRMDLASEIQLRDPKFDVNFL
jgi:hypothetical protein